MNRRLASLWQLLMEDRKKAGVLAFLLVLLTGVAIKTLLPFGPNASRAGQDRDGTTSPTQVGQSALSRTIDLLTRLRSSQLVEVAQSPRLSRNLFAVDEHRFPPPEVPDPTPDPPPDLNPTVDPPIEDADEIRAREIAQIRLEAEVFRLRSVVVGQSPLAVIELPGKGRSVIPLGGTLNGFKIVEVTTESVVLEKDEVRVRLWLPAATL